MWESNAVEITSKNVKHLSKTLSVLLLIFDGIWKQRECPQDYKVERPACREARIQFPVVRKHDSSERILPQIVLLLPSFESMRICDECQVELHPCNGRGPGFESRWLQQTGP